MAMPLEEIYYGRYERKFTRTPAYQEAAEAMGREWDAARETIGWERAERLWSLLLDVNTLEGLDDFRAGFRLGAALMLEALGEGE